MGRYRMTHRKARGLGFSRGRLVGYPLARRNDQGIVPAQVTSFDGGLYMAIGVYVSPKSMNAQQYDTCIRKLEAAGAGKPAGRSYHSCFGSGDKLAVFDVWDSQQSFDRFGETLLPILKEIGVDIGQPQVMPVHNVIEG
jgi:hypothetical protein